MALFLFAICAKIEFEIGKFVFFEWKNLAFLFGFASF